MKVTYQTIRFMLLEAFQQYIAQTGIDPVVVYLGEEEIDAFDAATKIHRASFRMSFGATGETKRSFMGIQVISVALKSHMDFGHDWRQHRLNWTR